MRSTQTYEKIFGREKKFPPRFIMSIHELESKCRKLQELKDFENEVKAEIAAMENEILLLCIDFRERIGYTDPTRSCLEVVPFTCVLVGLKSLLWRMKSKPLCKSRIQRS